MISREQQAGELYADGCKAVRNGGDDLHSVAMHLILMIKGTTQFIGPLWPVRELSDGKIVHLDRFVDYLLRPARDGLGLPSLHFLKQVLEATPRDGERALTMVRSELRKEHINFDEAARHDELRLHGERAPLRSAAGRPKAAENVSNVKIKGGNRAAYLAARLQRDHPNVARQLAAGEFKSVRAAAKAAGLIIEPTALERILKLLPKLRDNERRILRQQLDESEPQSS